MKSDHAIQALQLKYFKHIEQPFTKANTSTVLQMIGSIMLVQKYDRHQIIHVGGLMLVALACGFFFLIKLIF